METIDKVGEVKRTAFGALKKICEEYSTTTIIGDKARKFERICQNEIDKKRGKDKTQKISSDVPLFSADIIEQIKSQRENEDIVL